MYHQQSNLQKLDTFLFWRQIKTPKHMVKNTSSNWHRTNLRDYINILVEYNLNSWSDLVNLKFNLFTLLNESN